MNARGRTIGIGWVLFWAACLIGVSAARAVPVEVTGMGFFRNAELERRLAFLTGESEAPRPSLSLVDVEDQAYILLQLMRRDGFAEPEVTANLLDMAGEGTTRTWRLPFTSSEAEAEAGAAYTSVRFACQPGQLLFYESVEARGIRALEASEVGQFFIPAGVLFTRRSDRAFTPDNLEARLVRLLRVLRDKGYRDARVLDRQVEVDPSSGAVSIILSVEEGPLHLVGTVETLVKGEASVSPLESPLPSPILTPGWVREQRQYLLNQLYVKGFAQAEVHVEENLAGPGPEADTRLVDLVFQLDTGPAWTMGGVSFEPEGILRRSVINRQVRLPAEGPYNLLLVEEGRRRLLSLGVLSDVDLESRFLGGSVRGAHYTLHPLPRRTLSLQAGWGSYEQARIGARWEHLNLWQRAHRYEIEAKRSLKSYGIEATYAIPHFFDERITAFARIGHEFRQEISYDRSDSRLVLGASRRLKTPGAEVSLQYSLEELDSNRLTTREFIALDRATVSSLTLQAVLDRRDSALTPSRGYALGISTKVAADWIGGEANFLKVEANLSGHAFLGKALYLHAALRYGSLFAPSPAGANLPFNERFFPGGENTVRGYRRGEASPLSTGGELIGAESYLLGNLEMEQRILRNFSLVLFVDAVGLARDRQSLPDEEFLSSAGIGLRWRTPVGPVRLEYGHNLNARPEDPDGALHLAVGYPF